MGQRRHRTQEVARSLSPFSLNGSCTSAFASYDVSMILIRFPNIDAKRKALGRLAGHFGFKSWANGDMLVPEDALAFLAVEGIPFTVEGPATYEQNGSAFRGAAPVAV